MLLATVPARGFAEALPCLVLIKHAQLTLRMAHTHQAAEKLVLGSPVAGRPYFITNDEPRPFWEFLGDICEVQPTLYPCSFAVAVSCCCTRIQHVAFVNSHTHCRLHRPLTGFGLWAASHQAAFRLDLLSGMHI